MTTIKNYQHLANVISSLSFSCPLSLFLTQKVLVSYLFYTEQGVYVNPMTVLTASVLHSLLYP